MPILRNMSLPMQTFLRQLPIISSSRLWTVSAILWVVFALFTINAHHVYMDPDEELSYRATQGTLADTIAFQTGVQDNQAPLFFVTFWAWQQLVGPAEYTSRVMGILFGLLTLACTYRLGMRWLKNDPATLLVIALLSVNFFFFTYTLNIRPYPISIFVATASMWLFDRFLARPNRTRGIIYGLSVAVMLYTHYLLAFLLVVQAFIWLIRFWRTPRQWLTIIPYWVLGIVLWLPWAPIFVRQVLGLRDIESESGTGRGVAGIGVSTLTTSPETVLELATIATNSLWGVYLGIILVALVLSVLKRPRKGTLLPAWAWVIGVPAVALVVNLFAGAYAHRFISHISVGLALGIMGMLLVLPRSLRIVGIGLLIVGTVLMLPRQQDQFFPTRVPHNPILRAVAEEAQPEDVLYTQVIHDGLVDWQLAHVLPYDMSERQVSLELAQNTRRVWFITDRLLDADVQADFAALEMTHPVQSAHGECIRYWCFVAQLMETAPNEEPITFGSSLNFWGMDVDQLDAQQLDARLWWTVDESPELNFSFSFFIVNEAGELVSQWDGPINHYAVEIVETSQLTPRRFYIDHRSVSLSNLLSGTYRVALVVYQPWDGVRLTLPDGDDMLILHTFELN